MSRVEIDAKKRILSSGLILLLAFGVVLTTGCKKRKAFNEENAQEAIDSGTFRAESDAAMEDVNNAITNQFLLRGKGLSASETQGNLICGAVVDTTQVSQGIVVLNYDGSICASRKREGKITASIQDYPLKKWKQKGCVLKVEFAAYKVTGVNDGKSMKVDGAFYVTNESGSTWYDMRYLNVSSVVHGISGNDIRLSFSTTEFATVNIKRRCTYSISGSVITCRVEGLGNQDSKSGLDMWGTARGSSDFTSEMVTPVVWRTGCGAHMPLQGQVKVNVSGKYFELTSTYGVDDGGNEVSDGSCPYGWKVSWSYKSKTNKRIFSYQR